METKNAIAALAALAQASRLAVFRLLVQQGPSGLAAGEIASQLGVTPANLTFHLKELAHAGLVTSQQKGRFVFYSANFDVMNTLLAYLTENCCAADCGPCAPTVACEPASRRRAARSTRESKRSKV